jgi:tripartite-type tricarboxylate transporter receptor subunit TctC
MKPFVPVLQAATAVLVAVLAAPLATAQPQLCAGKPVKLVVPFPPGGNVDLSARILQPELSKRLGQPVVIDNRAGAGGTLGLDAVAKAAPDGCVLGIASPINHLAAPALYPKLPYDPVRSFTPIGLVASVPMVLVVGSSSPVRTVGDLIALAKSRKTPLTMASAGGGSGNHIVGELFQEAAGIKFVHVPYKGSAPANTDLAGGHVDLHIDQLSSVLPLLQGGKLRALAVTTAKRSPLLPEVPTLAESGVAGFDASTTLGLVMPAGVAPETAAQLNALLNDSLQQPAVQEQFTKLGAQPRPGTREQYAEFIRSEVARTARIVRQAGITLD